MEFFVQRSYIFFFAIVSPIFLVSLLYQWGVVKAPEVLSDTNTYVVIARLFIIATLVLLAFVAIDSRRRYLSGPHL